MPNDFPELGVFQLDDPRWRQFATNGAGSTPFHHPAWAQLLMHTYGYRGFAATIRDSQGRVTAGAPFLEVRSISRRRSWISLPFTDECAPLAESPSERTKLAASLATFQARRSGPAVVVRGTMDGVGWRTRADAVTHELELGAEVDDVRQRFSRSQVLRNIVRAEREGVIVRHASTAGDLEAFYALHTRTRRRQGVPVQPRRFFELLWSRLVGPGLASILLADAPGKRAVAGALFLRAGGITVYKFGASDPEGWPTRPNHLIFWTAIQEACARGDRRFDFGRTDLGNDGLRAFKSSWGGQERPLIHSTLEPGATTGAEGTLKRALSVAIRRGPPWICRGVGEALYRFAASR